MNKMYKDYQQLKHHSSTRIIKKIWWIALC